MAPMTTSPPCREPHSKTDPSVLDPFAGAFEATFHDVDLAHHDDNDQLTQKSKPTGEFAEQFVSVQMLRSSRL
jgi:hypothetical protein